MIIKIEIIFIIVRKWASNKMIKKRDRKVGTIR